MNRFEIEERLVELTPKYPEFRGMSFEGYQKHIASKYKCPVCGKPVFLRERHDDGTVFFGCSRFPYCKWSQSFGYTIHDRIWEDGIVPFGGYDERDDEDDWDGEDDWASDWESPMYWG